jgi:dihydroxyacid dehydratase/phosphogluconate dehydratase
VDLTLDDWDRCGRDVPTIVNLMPSGKYLMEEFFYAGGLPVVIKLWSRNDRNPGGEAISTPTAIATPIMAERNLCI